MDGDLELHTTPKVHPGIKVLGDWGDGFSISALFYQQHSFGIPSMFSKTVLVSCMSFHLCLSSSKTADLLAIISFGKDP